VRRRASTLALAAALALSLLAPACAGNRAHLDWRPGLSELDFEGKFEISLNEFQSFTDEAAANVSFDRIRGGADLAEAGAAMAAIGETLANPDPRGYAIIELPGDGSVTLIGDRGKTHGGAVDWFASSPDRRKAALLSGTRLAVAFNGASTGIDVGSLLGTSLGGYRLLMVERDGELTVFALPELGGAVSAHEPGYLFAFRHRAGGREPWEISVARVVIRA
jgi:hypothetical protein